MTTICYDATRNVVAVDSRATMGNLIATDECQKWHITEDFVFFLSGAVHEIELVHEYYPNIQFQGNSSCQGFVYERATGKLLSIGWHEGKEINTHVKYNFAFGSGMMHALTALDLGKSAKRAVEIAAMRDAGTGGKVHVFQLDKFRVEGIEPIPLEPGQVVLIQGSGDVELKGNKKKR